VTWEQFYSSARLGNRFGKQGIFYGPRGHLGVDYRHGSGTPIPAWCEGTVADVRYFARLGYTIIIRRKDGTYAGFCHMKARPKLNIGNHVAVGQTVGLVGHTGTASTGPHLHATLEPTVTIGTANAIDPLPHILKATTTPPTGVDDMRLIRRTGSATTEWSLFHPTLAGPTAIERGYITTTDPAIARGWARTWGDGLGNEKSEPRDVYVEMQAAARLTYAPPVPADLTPVLAELDKLTADVNRARTLT